MKNHSASHSAVKMAYALDVSRSGYYSYLKRGVSNRSKENSELVLKIREVFTSSRKTYGSPRVTSELRENGFSCSENRVARLMKAGGIAAKSKRKFKRTTNSHHNHQVAANHLNGNFSFQSPDQAWVSDITYVYTREGWLYLATVLDLYSRAVIGWSMSERLKKELVIDAFKQAVASRRPAMGLIFHSDRGSQYASDEFRKLLSDREIVQSMSGRGNCYDNAVAESFFATLKTELMKGVVFATRQQARTEIFEYIEVFYNRKRRHSALEYKAPFEFEKSAIIT